MSDIVKYPRTRHIAGSRLQPGDEDLSAAPFSVLARRHVVVEEKIDGANSAISFDEDGKLRLQSRGHYLRGGRRERHFALLKRWAHSHAHVFRPVLSDRYIVYGEWAYAKHTIFYDALPHYFLEFDVLDRQSDTFLDTPARKALLAELPFTSVPVLHSGDIDSVATLKALVQPSLYKTAGWRESLRLAAQTGEAQRWGSPERAEQETDRSDMSEGLYIKVEENGRVLGRYKWVRASFVTAVKDSGGHWLSRPIVANGLADDAAADIAALANERVTDA